MSYATNPLLPRLPDTMEAEHAIRNWVADYFDRKAEWMWADKLNQIFRIIGRQGMYRLRREGRWWVVYRV